MTKSNSSKVMFLNDLSRRMPALLTTMSTVPNAATASSTMLLAPSRSATDALLAMAGAAGGLDLFDHGIGSVGFALAMHGPAQIVHHHLRAARRERQRMAATKTIAGPGNDGHPSLEITHGSSLRWKQQSDYLTLSRLPDTSKISPSVPPRVR